MLLGTSVPLGHGPSAVPQPPAGLVSGCGMIGLDMFICCLFKVHFLGASRRQWGGFEGLARCGPAAAAA